MISGADDPLFGEAKRQLEGMPRSISGWDRLWETVFEAAPSAALAEEGLAWLQEAAPDVLAWGHVFCALARFDVSEALWRELSSWVEHAPLDAPAHRQLGPLVTWVRTQKDSGNEITLERAEALRALLPRARELPLSSYASPPAVTGLKDLLPGRDGMAPEPSEACAQLALLLPALDGVHAHREWRKDWFVVWSRFTDAEAFDLALQWLRQAPEKAGRSYILRALWDGGVRWRASLVPPTFEYLDVADPDTKEWLPLWERLRQLPPGILNEEETRTLHELEERYLQGYPDKEAPWRSASSDPSAR